MEENKNKKKIIAKFLFEWNEFETKYYYIKTEKNGQRAKQTKQQKKKNDSNGNACVMSRMSNEKWYKHRANNNNKKETYEMQIERNAVSAEPVLEIPHTNRIKKKKRNVECSVSLSAFAVFVLHLKTIWYYVIGVSMNVYLRRLFLFFFSLVLSRLCLFCCGFVSLSSCCVCVFLFFSFLSHKQLKSNRKYFLPSFGHRKNILLLVGWERCNGTQSWINWW